MSNFVLHSAGVESHNGAYVTSRAIIGKSGRKVDPVELARFCESRLPRFAIPRYIDVVSDLPRTENSKVQKYKLRERSVTASTWDRQPVARGPSARTP